jgi:hypothetical protein
MKLEYHLLTDGLPGIVAEQAAEANDMKRCTSKRSLGFLLLTAAVGLSSCSDGRVPVYPVRGQVLYRGEPAAYAILMFHPEKPLDELAGMIPRGQADAEGRFALKTYSEADGAPAGRYKVAIEWPGDEPKVPVDRDDPEYVPTGADRLAGRYAQAERSPLTATIEPGENQLPPFQLE